MTQFRCITLSLLLLLGFSAIARGQEISFRDAALIKGEIITLGDVATLSPAATPEALALAGQRVGRAPEPGEKLVLQADELKKLLTEQDASLASANFQWSGARQIVAKREAIEIGPAEIRAQLEKFLNKSEGILPQAEVRFKNLSLPQPFNLPAGRLELEIIPSDPSILDSQRFTLIYRVDGRVVKNISVRGELEALAPVIVAANDLARGSRIRPQDINVATLDLVGLRNPCFAPEELIGMEVKRSIRQGKPVNRQWVEEPAAILRGQTVTITARKGGLRVTAKGIARHDAIQGAPITVLNNNSQKEVAGRVSAPGEVTVEL
ncbi:MAG: flagella basal body P-ring formation protein FlgA [Deltaproteobacteria bacterium RIFOXYD12_FULL_57_12]|nr:MAG: flagella basal body P-ring formation protein FlgA [Deltaproteobacteria bacterium RIFOXYD12_FULL_57_12]